METIPLSSESPLSYNMPKFGELEFRPSTVHVPVCDVVSVLIV